MGCTYQQGRNDWSGNGNFIDGLNRSMIQWPDDDLFEKSEEKNVLIKCPTDSYILTLRTQDKTTIFKIHRIFPVCVSLYP